MSCSNLVTAKLASSQPKKQMAEFIWTRGNLQSLDVSLPLKSFEIDYLILKHKDILRIFRTQPVYLRLGELLRFDENRWKQKLRGNFETAKGLFWKHLLRSERLHSTSFHYHQVHWPYLKCLFRAPVLSSLRELTLWYFPSTTTNTLLLLKTISQLSRLDALTLYFDRERSCDLRGIMANSLQPIISDGRISNLDVCCRRVDQSLYLGCLHRRLRDNGREAFKRLRLEGIRNSIILRAILGKCCQAMVTKCLIAGKELPSSFSDSQKQFLHQVVGLLYDWKYAT